MSTPVTIIDYGVGNILSVRGAFDHCDADSVTTNNPLEIEKAERLVLPGVGAFGDCIAEMHAAGLIEPVWRFVETGRPLLGICVGMQMLTNMSEEFGRHEGLGLIAGTVVAIPSTGADGKPHRIPHVGWNQLTNPQFIPWTSTVLEGVDEGAWVYFVHSFMAVPDDPSCRLADVDYNGLKIAAVIRRDNVMGCQFHPEKSGTAGLSIIQNFLQI